MTFRNVIAVLATICLALYHKSENWNYNKSGDVQWCQLAAQMSLGASQCVCSDGPITYFPMNGGTAAEIVSYTTTLTDNEGDKIAVSVGDDTMYLFKKINLTYRASTKSYFII